MVNYYFALPILTGGLEHVRNCLNRTRILRNVMNFGCLAGARLDSTLATPGSGAADLWNNEYRNRNPLKCSKNSLHQITHGL